MLAIVYREKFVQPYWSEYARMPDLNLIEVGLSLKAGLPPPDLRRGEPFTFEIRKCGRVGATINLGDRIVTYKDCVIQASRRASFSDPEDDTVIFTLRFRAILAD